MPIPSFPGSTPGEYPQDIRHILNGDALNQTQLQAPSIDLEYRTDVLRDYINNNLEPLIQSNANSAAAFDQNHDHSGANGEKVLNFSQIYKNSNQVESSFVLALNGAWTVKSNGSVTDLFRIKDNAPTDRDKVKFAGSDFLHNHAESAASDLSLRPHNLALQGRQHTLSLNCEVDTGAAAVQSITLDPTEPEGGVGSATGLAGKESSDGYANEGVVVADHTDNTEQYPIHTVQVLAAPNDPLIGPNALPEPVLNGSGEVIYGLLGNTGTVPVPVWQLSFYTISGPHSFPQGTNRNVILLGTEAFTPTSAPVTPRSFINSAKRGFGFL